MSNDDYDYVFGSVVHRGLFECFKEVPQFLNHIDKICTSNYFNKVENVQPITILQKAVLSRETDFVVWLLDSGANVNHPGGIGKTPIQLALETGNKDLAILLLQRGAKL